MGNSVCPHASKPRKSEDAAPKHVLEATSAKSSAESMSIIIPDLSHKPSVEISAVPSMLSNTSEYSWSKMHSLFVEHTFLNETDELTPTIIRNVALIFETLNLKIEHIYFELVENPQIVHEYVLNKFDECMKTTEAKMKIRSLERAITHYIMITEFHNIILDELKRGNDATAFDLFNQIAISHALIGITPGDFRMMNLDIVLYLLRYHHIEEYQLTDIVIYFNTVAKHIKDFFDAQYQTRTSLKTSSLTNLTISTMTSDRNSKARENYRLMKKWNTNMETLRVKVQHLEELWAKKCFLQPSSKDMAASNSFL